MHDILYYTYGWMIRYNMNMRMTLCHAIGRHKWRGAVANGWRGRETAVTAGQRWRQFVSKQSSVKCHLLSQLSHQGSCQPTQAVARLPWCPRFHPCSTLPTLCNSMRPRAHPGLNMFVVTEKGKMAGLALSGGTLLSVLQGKRVYQPIWQIIAVQTPSPGSNTSNQLLVSDGKQTFI